MTQINGDEMDVTRSVGTAPHTVSGFVPEAIQDYLAHTGGGVSIRDLARQSACHASTILRRIRRVEQQRDDPLVDAALRRLEAGLPSKALRRQGSMDLNTEAMQMMHDKTLSPAALKTFEKEAMRVLRRLCETGAVLAIAQDMDMAVVVREMGEGATTRTAVVSQDVAQSIALRGWIETVVEGRILRYTITPKGREAVLDLIARHTDGGTSQELAEAPSRFDPAPGVLVPDALARKIRYNLAESPLAALARRRDKRGEAFLGDDLVRSGERLREDYELAQMDLQATEDWASLVSESSTPEDGPSFGPEAAKVRVVAALRDLGPGLSDVALRCCCHLEGLESTEKKMGWSARSGKIVLRIALQRLKRHYDENLTQDAQMIG